MVHGSTANRHAGLPDMRRFPLPSLIETISFLFLMAVIAGGFAVAPDLDAATSISRIDAQ